jgi:flagellar hook-associated protein 1 FlgK
MLSAARSEASAASTRRDNSFAARDETAGIDLDREAADLMRFQQAYSASAKIIQAGRDTLQSILDLF